jgi:hypothetical protein
MNTSTKTIEITVDSEGGVSVKTKGFTGSSCKDASRFIEQALGQSSHETLLPEYFQQTHASDQIRQGS